MANQEANDLGCCKFEAVISVDERGQMVLPKEVREKIEMKAGDKLAVISLDIGQQQCCLVLMKTNKLEEMVKNILGSFLETVMKQQE